MGFQALLAPVMGMYTCSGEFCSCPEALKRETDRALRRVTWILATNNAARDYGYSKLFRPSWKRRSLHITEGYSCPQTLNRESEVKAVARVHLPEGNGNVGLSCHSIIWP
jgi:hypothetical protein